MNTTAGPLPPPLPPSLPPRPQVQAADGPRRRFGLPAWLIALIVACILMFAVLGTLIAWGVGTGWHLFAAQAQAALQLQPAVREHIGTIGEMHVDFLATGEARGGDEFVFRLQGDRGSGRVSANFVSDGASREIITDGVLTLANGARLPLEDQSSTDATECADDTCIDPTDDSLEHA